MKKYVLFGFDFYYPNGGMNDLIDGFDTSTEAEQHAIKLINKRKIEDYQIVDRDSWQIVKQKEF